MTGSEILAAVREECERSHVGERLDVQIVNDGTAVVVRIGSGPRSASGIAMGCFDTTISAPPSEIVAAVRRALLRLDERSEREFEALVSDPLLALFREWCAKKGVVGE